MVMKKSIVLFLIMVFPLFSVSVKAQVIEIDLQVGYYDPTFENGGQRSTIQIPIIGIDHQNIYFYTSCDNFALHLINEYNKVEYATIIPSGTHTLVFRKQFRRPSKHSFIRRKHQK